MNVIAAAVVISNSSNIPNRRNKNTTDDNGELFAEVERLVPVVRRLY